MNKNRIRWHANWQMKWYSEYELSLMRAKWERVSQIVEEHIKTNNLSII